jgi:Holliday junction resolvase RusA-like endonuclease
MSDDVFRVTLALPPSVNHGLAPVRMGRAGALRLVKSREAKKWAQVVHAHLLTVRKPPALRKGPVALTLEVHVPSIASDGGNRLKPLEDALVRAGVLSDDRQIAEWRITKHVAEGKPRVVVELRSADPEKHPELAARLARAETKVQQFLRGKP